MSHNIEVYGTEEGAVLVTVPDAHGNPLKFYAYSVEEANDLSRRIMEATAKALENLSRNAARKAVDKATYTPETKPVVKRKGRT